MTSIFDAILLAALPADALATESVLTFLGIDPDLPAEWATVDRCLEWLRDQAGHEAHLAGGWGDYVVSISRVALPNMRADGRTLHAALIALCQAIEEAS